MIKELSKITQELKQVPDQFYKKVITVNNFSLKELTGLNIYVVGDMETVRLFRKYKDGQTIAISLNIPFYDKKHPEKLVATSFNMFAVFKYTKQDDYISQEIDWHLFKEKFNECLLKICRY